MKHGLISLAIVLAAFDVVSAVDEGRAQAKRRDWKAAAAGLGYVLRHQGRYEESVRAYQKALRLKPDYPAALEYLGEAYVKMGRVDDARRLLEKL